jgi:tol-pal system protein YbgF
LQTGKVRDNNPMRCGLKISKFPCAQRGWHRFTSELARAALLLLAASSAPGLAADESNAAAGNNTAVRLIELINQNEALSSDMTKLRGQLEEILDTIKQSQERQKKIAADLDSRIGKIEAERKSQSGASQVNIKALEDKIRDLERSLAVLHKTIADTKQADEDPAQKAYDTAIKSFEAGDYPAATRYLSAYVELFPNDAAAPDARYWLGEALWRQREFAAAIEAEEKLLADHPESKKSPAALLLIGKAQLALGETDAAKQAWEQLIERHPKSEPARKARELLQQLP